MMNESAEVQRSQLPERNPVTHKAHRREVFWQITLPLVLGILLVLALAAGAALGSSNNVSRWADVSLIWIIIPLLFVLFIFLILTAGLAYGIIQLIHKLPPYASLAQHFLKRVQEKVKQGTGAAVEPVLRVHSFQAAWRAFWRSRKF